MGVAWCLGELVLRVPWLRAPPGSSVAGTCLDIRARARHHSSHGEVLPRGEQSDQVVQGQAGRWGTMALARSVADAIAHLSHVQGFGVEGRLGFGVSLDAAMDP